jgi:fatty-acyl-CoA synthase
MTSRLRTLPEALDAAARSGEGFVFIVDDVEQRRSYAEIQQGAWRFAAALADRGLRPGDVVALAIEDAESFLTALLGASIARVIPASLAPPAVTAELSGYFDLTAPLLRASGARAIVTSAQLVAGFEAARRSCPTIDFVLSRDDLDAAARPPDAWPALDEIAFVQFTSGSTSSPKGVALTHANVSANIDAINGPAGLATTAEDSAVSWLPFHHDMGLVGMALGPLFASRPAVFLTPQAFIKRPADWLKALSRHRATVSFAPNFAYDLVVRRLKDRDLDGLDLSRWRIAGCGAEPIHPVTLATFADRLAGVGFRPASFLPCYGLAEHVLAATLPPRDRGPVIDRSLVGCGRPLPGHRLRLVKTDGSEAERGEVGEVTLNGPSVMLGYFNDAASTAEIIRNGWLHTGDLGYVVDGDLFICGRIKEVIIANGRKYHPQDLEWAIDDVDGMRRGRAVAFAAAGNEQSDRRDRVVVVVEVGNAQPFEGLASAIRRRISERFGLYVDDIVPVPSGTIERTTSGKVKRTAMKAWYEQQGRA